MGRMDSALAVIVWVGLVLVGPPALLFWLIRRRKRRERALRDATIAAAADPSPALEQASNISIDSTSFATPTEQSRYRFSFPYGVPVVVYPILAVGLSAVQRTWLVALLVLLLVILAVAFTREAFSRASFDKIRASDPSMNLATWRINWMLFFAAPPAVLAVFGAARLWLGKSG
jgi:hypothetical protein